MEELGAILWVWAMHTGIAGVLTAPVVFLSRKRVRWRYWELLVLVLPFSVWSVLMFSELSTGRKSLANLVEPLYFAAAVPLGALVRVVVGTRIPERVCAGGLIAGICIVAGAVFFLVPPLPE